MTEKIVLRDIPDFDLPQESVEHRRAHVYLEVGVTVRNSDDVGYTKTVHRKWVSREEWFSATDSEREAAIQEGCAYVAKNSAKTLS
ncbi:hypothetical protein [Streptomyces sp. NPDC002644]